MDESKARVNEEHEDEEHENGPRRAEVEGHVRPPDDHVPVGRADGEKKAEKGPHPEAPERQRTRLAPLFQDGAVAVIEMSLVGGGDLLLQTLTLAQH